MKSSGHSRSSINRLISSRGGNTDTADPEDLALGVPSSTPAPATTLVVIGASAGGHHALATIVKDLPADLPAAVAITLHISRASKFILPHWLAQFGHLSVTIPHEGEAVQNGHVYVAPPGRQVSILHGILHVESLTKDAERSRVIDSLFLSAALDYKDRAIGVILTGSGTDGSAGLRAIYESGGLTVVQDPKSAQHRGMPSNAMKDLQVDYCLNLQDVAPALDLLVRANARLETGLAMSLRFLKERIALLVRLRDQSKKNPDVTKFLTSELDALDAEVREIRKLIAGAPRNHRTHNNRRSSL